MKPETFPVKILRIQDGLTKILVYAGVFSGIRNLVLYNATGKKEKDEKMTERQMRNIIEEEFPDFSHEQRIVEIYSKDFLSLGICCESNMDHNDIYIYNIFADSEYINICGHGTKENPLPNEILKELTSKWNELIIKKARKDNE